MRLLVLIGVIGAASALQAQTPTTSVQPSANKTQSLDSNASHTAGKATPIAVLPTLGFLVDPSGAGLVAIRGMASGPVSAEPVAKPDGVTRIFLPPREHYAIVVQGSSNTLAVWHLAHPRRANGSELLDVMPGAFAHPEMVTFSPKGSAAALYSSSAGRIQVIRGLPGQPAIAAEIPIQHLETEPELALSDDGQLVVAANLNGQMQLSLAGKEFQQMPWTYLPSAITFLPNTHSLVISDSQQNGLVLLPDIEMRSAPVMLGNGLQADHLSATSSGEVVIALDAAHQKLWEIDNKTFAVRGIALSQNAQMLVTLRDGHTFLLSSAPVTVLKVTDSVSAPAIVVHSVTIGSTGDKQ